MKSLILIASIFALVGCGSDGDTYVDSGPAIPEVPNPDGTALIVTASDSSSAGITYTEVSDGSILVDCGDGGCGNVLIGSPITDNSNTSSESDSNSSEYINKKTKDTSWKT